MQSIVIYTVCFDNEMMTKFTRKGWNDKPEGRRPFDCVIMSPLIHPS